MARPRREKVARYHDRVAHQYDHIYDDLYWRWHDTLTWDYLKPHLPRDRSAAIVDLGCGTGKWGIKVAQSGYAVTCLDISHKMVETVRRKILELGLEHRVSCLQGDLADLAELPDAGFALAMAFGEPLCCVRSLPGALGEVRRVLQSGGLLVATIDNRISALDLYLERGDVPGLQNFLKTGRTHWLTRDREEQFELHTYTPSQFRKHLGAAGFEVLEMLGKTVLPMRKHRELLEDSRVFRQLVALEKKLGRDPDGWGRAAHLQVTARKI